MTPIPLVLELWAAGHSGRYIAHKLGLPSRRQVERVVAHAREIGDPRAVLHVCAHSKKVAGHPHKAKRLLIEDPTIEVVALKPWLNRPGGDTECSKGHPLSGSNIYIVPSSGKRECRECRQNRSRLRYERKAK